MPRVGFVKIILRTQRPENGATPIAGTGTKIFLLGQCDGAVGAVIVMGEPCGGGGLIRRPLELDLTS
jgi:hypothetical protein